MSPAATLSARIAESARVLRERGFPRPAVGMVLGTGLGGLGEALESPRAAAYEEIPHFRRSTVESHAGRLLTGRLAGVSVVAMQGRFHMYEGYSLADVTFPVRVMRALGADVLILTNAAGGLNPLFARGDLMLVDDHINLMGDNPLRGPNEDELGPRFPDMSEPYDRRLLDLAERAGLEERIVLRRGVLAALSGPALETRAEYRFLRLAGADAVTMSSVPEAIVGNHAGMRVLGISVLTDMCLPDALEPVSVPEILRVASEAGPRLARVITAVLTRLSADG